MTGLNDAFVIDKETRDTLISEDPKSDDIIKPFLAGRDIKRYMTPRSNKFLIFTRRGINIQEYPAIERHLLKYKDRLTPKPNGWAGKDWKGRKPGAYKWYEIQDTIDYYEEFEKPKIISPAIIKSASFTMDAEGMYSNDKTTIIAVSDPYLLGILNSQVSDFVTHLIASTKQGGYFEYKPTYLSKIPIIDGSHGSFLTYSGQVVELATLVLALNEKLATVKTPYEKTAVQSQISATDRQIDQMVYELYGLNDTEIRIVERAVK